MKISSEFSTSTKDLSMKKSSSVLPLPHLQLFWSAKHLQCDYKNRGHPEKKRTQNFEISQSQVKIKTMKLHIISYTEPVQNT